MTTKFIVLLLSLVGHVTGFSNAAGSCSIPSGSMPATQTSGADAAMPASTGIDEDTLPASWSPDTPYTIDVLGGSSGIRGVLIWASQNGQTVGSWSYDTTDSRLQFKTGCNGDTGAITHTGEFNCVGEANRCSQGVGGGVAATATVTFPAALSSAAPNTISFHATVVVGRVGSEYEWYTHDFEVEGPAVVATPSPSPAPSGAPPMPTAQCEAYCTEIQETCQTVPQFLDTTSCLTMCNAWTVGDPADTTGDTFFCRAYHLDAANFYLTQNDLALRDVHCQHAGPTGGDVCGDFCEVYCNTMDDFCTGDNTQYVDAAACRGICGDFDQGNQDADITVTSGASLECRFYHLQVASGSAGAAQVHCPHAGSYGGNACGTPCEAYCDHAVSELCDPEIGFTDRAQCLTECEAFDMTGAFGDTSGDTLQCRLYHVEVAAYTTDVQHCGHAAPDSLNADDTLGPCADPCGDFCSRITTACSGDDAQFVDEDFCMAWCENQISGAAAGGNLTAIPDGTNTLDCSVFHLGAVEFYISENNPDLVSAHCSHAGPSGGGTCPPDPCEAYCADQLTVCSNDVQYPGFGALGVDSMTHCMAVCSAFDQSNIVDAYTQPFFADPVNNETLGCRIYHLSVAAFTDPGTHCAHSGFDGDGVCGDACNTYCDLMAAACPGTTFTTDCQTSCNAYIAADTGFFGQVTAGDSLDCRLYHAQVALLLGGNDNVHCTHASEDGANICSDACEDFCTAALTACPDSYASQSSCVGQCLAMEPSGADADTLECRATALAAGDCSAVGPTGQGTDTCGDVCANYCTRLFSVCSGANAQFQDAAQCEAYCAAGYPTGDLIAAGTWSTSNATLQNSDLDCRFLALENILAGTDTPASFCGAAGPTGESDTGPVCGGLSSNFVTLYENACPAGAATYGGGSVALTDYIVTLSMNTPDGTVGETSGDTMACRFYHAGVALLDGTPDNVHCDHASLDGAGVCVDAPDCASYCDLVTTTCDPDQYAGVDSQAWCETFCGRDIEIGATGDQSGNTVGCRESWAEVAAAAAAGSTERTTACDAAGFSGGDVCGEICDNYCEQIMSLCTDLNAQYDNEAHCLAVCNAFNTAAPFDASITSGDSLACRSYHLQVASTPATTTKRAHGPNADVHCDHAGPFGTDRSGDGTAAVCGNGCDAYCTLFEFGCATEFASDYTDRQGCLDACAMFPTDSFGATGGDSLQCRFYHVGVALQTEPQVHCPHAGLDGGGVCADSCVGTEITINVASKPTGAVGYLDGYTVNGELQPELCLEAGQTYCFKTTTSDCFHPFYIATEVGSGGQQFAANAVTDGIGTSSPQLACNGQTIEWTPSAGTYYAQCSVHAGMGFPISVLDSTPSEMLSCGDYCSETTEFIVNDDCVSDPCGAGCSPLNPSACCATGETCNGAGVCGTPPTPSPIVTDVSPTETGAETTGEAGPGAGAGEDSADEEASSVLLSSIFALVTLL